MNTTITGKAVLLLLLPLIPFVYSCKQKFNESDYSAYIQGEVINPISDYVLFCKDEKVLDTLYLDQNNHFFKKFDSLAPGMYIYKHSPEFQYVYFDKNDSLNIRLNTRDFDHSIIFSGRGAEKNNFLMTLTVKNLVDESTRHENYDLPLHRFISKQDSTHAARTTFYLRNKAIIGWDNGFDSYAKAKLDLHFFSQKEIYPLAHFLRTGEDVRKELPADYYSFRKKVDFNNENLIQYSSYTRYLSIMLNALSNASEIEFNKERRLDNNIEKLNIIDTLISNAKVKNTILDNITYIYLLEDQNLNNNDKFLERYFELSTDDSQHDEISNIQRSVQNLKYEQRLPDVDLIDIKAKEVHINQVFKKPTFVFVWTKNSFGHAEAAHRKAMKILQHNPKIDIISVCIDGEQEEWVDFVANYNHPNLIKVRSTNFNQMRDKWIITKIQRSMIINADGSIRDPFVNIFDPHIETQLL